MDEDEEIVVGINIPKEKKKKEKKKNKEKKVEKTNKIKKTKSSKPKKNKARIFGNSKIFRNRLLRRLFMILLIIIVICIILSSSIFDVKEINVQNNESISSEEVINLSEIKGKNIFSIKEKEVEKLIQKNPYIKSISLSKKIPNKVEIQVVDRKPKYMIQLGDAYIYIDSMGYILDIKKDKGEVPILIGIQTDLSKLKKGNVLEEKDINKIQVANKICDTTKNNDIDSYITKIDISDPENYALILEGEEKTAYLGECTDLNTRILYIKAIIEQEKGKAGEIFVNVDLNKKNVFFREKI